MRSLILYFSDDENLLEYRLVQSAGNLAEGSLNIDIPFMALPAGLRAEFVEDCWNLKCTGTEKFLLNGVEFSQKKLCREEFLLFSNVPDGHKFQIYVEEEKTSIFLKKYDIREIANLSVGSSDNNDIVYKSPRITPNYLIIKIENGNASFKCDNEKSAFLNGKRATSATLSFGDVINILGLKIVYMKDFIAINNPQTLVKCKFKEYLEKDFGIKTEETSIKYKEYFQRSPRIIKKLEEWQVLLDAPPLPDTNKDQPFLITIGPSFFMGFAMVASLMYTFSSSKSNPDMMIPGVVMTGAMLAGTVLWPILSRIFTKSVQQKEEINRKKRYRAYIQKEYSKIEESIEKNRKVLSGIYPEPTVCINRVINKDRRLWERVPSNKDFLDLRLGNGMKPSTIDVVLPKQSFSMIDDPLLDELIELDKGFATMNNVPISISFPENTLVGMIGEKKMIFETAMSMIVQIASLHSYDEVKVVCVFPYNEKNSWEWVKKLPHVWGPEKNTRFVASTRDEVREIFLYLNEVLTQREEAKRDYTTQIMSIPHFVVFISDPDLVDNEPVMRYLSNSSKDLGVTTVFLYEKLDLLPKECKAFIQLLDNECNIYHRDNPEGEVISFKPDKIQFHDLEAFSRTLAAMKVKEVASELSLPSSLTFFEMYRAGRVEHLDIKRRWRENLSYRSLEAPLGIKAGDTTFFLNIHEKYHGPHGLIAGMTGSGKSEFIQSYILSMAVNYHPHDVSFILIDYKGGGMANCFKGLPHIAGVITNLGGSQIRRSLVSLESELKKRQRVFAEYGVNHIDKYQELYKEHKAKEPLPHLIIISDEFAELKSQQPEFMQELTSAARIGRSLGVHLILATQKPSGVVDDQIWSNSRFRICLKVLDKNDSHEMIKRSDAANIIEPGRCFVQVGNDEIFELVQSGWSGAPYLPSDKVENEEDKKLSLIDNCGRTLKTVAKKHSSAKQSKSQINAVVDHISELSEKEGLMPLKLWLEPLKATVCLEDLRSKEEGWNGIEWKLCQSWICPVIGIIDDPKNQMQVPLAINIGTEGHVALFGAPGTGKTTFIQTLIYSLVTSYAPDAVNIYIADFGGRSVGYFNDLPHVGGVVLSEEANKLDKLFRLLIKEMESRKKIFAEYSVGSLKSYMEATDNKISAKVFILDNYEGFAELYPDYEQYIHTLSREGGNYGIYLVLTASNAGAIKYKILNNFKLVLTLCLNDKYDYISLMGQTNGLEPEHLPGRGLVKIREPLEFQTALALKSENDIQRVNILKQVFKEMAQKWSGLKALRIPEVPQHIDYETVFTYEDGKLLAQEWKMPVGYDIQEAEIVSIEAESIFIYPIIGSEKSGKTNFLKYLALAYKKEFHWKTYIVECERELEAFSMENQLDDYICEMDDFDSFIDTLIKEMVSRNKEIKELPTSEQNHKKQQEYIKNFEKIVVLIDDFNSFYRMMSEKALGLLENIVKGGSNLGVHFIITANPLDVSKYSGSILYNNIFNGSTGILLGGGLNLQDIFDVNMDYQQRSVQLEAGQGYLIERNSYKIVRTPLIL